jgi:RND family efflux transporter MFP subunit
MGLYQTHNCNVLGEIMRNFISLLAVSLLLIACKDDVTENETVPVRGLKTVLIKDTERTTVRRFPSVLQPSSISALSFEVAGKLEEVTLKVGQHVKKGQMIAEIDPTSLELKLDNSKAAVDLARATFKKASDNLARQEKLLSKGSVTAVSVDNARTDAATTAAQLVQAEKSLASAAEDLTKAVLVAPYDGIINTMDVESFATIASGTPIATIYAANAFEVSFSVNFEIVSLLAVGKRAKVKLADNPTIVLDAVVSELGSRADTVSSFPVVVALTDSDPSIKAGMAVEVSLEFQLPNGLGFTLPLSAAIKEGQIKSKGKRTDPSPMGVYVYDPETSTVIKRQVQVAGVRENSLLIVEGLTAGERVASAGVSFLRDGLKVKLLPDSE